MEALKDSEKEALQELIKFANYKMLAVFQKIFI